MKGYMRFLLVLTAVLMLWQCSPGPKDYLDESYKKKAERMEWWTDARFGMFIHWGVYAVPAGEWDGRRDEGIGEWIQAHLDIPPEEYKKFADAFNPTEFNAREWVSLAKDAGMKYLVITAKHHDGFALYDSQVSEWDVIDATPYETDILAELSKECKKQGIKFCTYYSILDWHHPAQYVDPDAESRGAGYARNKIYEDKKAAYVEYMKAQLSEILENYDPAVLWFDGEWVEWWTKEDGRELYNWLRNKKPSLIINNRIGSGRQGMQGMSKDETYAGDFGTPEQEIPDTGLDSLFWESCMTMNDTWGYKYFDDNWKSSETLVQNLVDVVSKGGNYLLNVGPKADGTIPEPSVVRLEDIGEWMDVYGESIWEAEASPYEKPEWGRYTFKPGELYVHVFDWPDVSKLTVPVETAKIQEAVLMNKRKSALEFKSADTGTEIILPAKAPNTMVSVVQLTLDE